MKTTKFDLKIVFILLLSMFAIVSCGGGGSGGGVGGSGDGGGGGSAQATACTDAAVANLQAISVTPTNGATNVSVRTNIAAKFNTCVNMATVSSSTFMLSNGGMPISGSYVLDGANHTVVFTPSQNLNYNATYAVLITNGITGSKGETFTGTGWGFFTRVTADTVPPTTIPSVSAGNYNTAQTVALNCDDGPSGTGCAATYYTTNGSVPSVASTRYAGPISINSTTTLKFFSVDVDGNAEAVNTAGYVIDTVPPTAMTFPANLAVNFALTGVVQATFNEPVLPSTLTNASFYLDNGAAALVSYDATTLTATLTPLERLACNTTHTATLTTGVSDLAGNKLASNAIWSFTTNSDCTEPSTTASLAAGAYTSAQSVALTCSDGAGSGCARIVYTTDGSVPSLSPVNGTVISAASAGPISIPVGDTLLRYFAEDNAGNREVERRQQYSVSTNGFTYVATNGGISRGVGPVPNSFVNVKAPGNTLGYFADTSNGRFYRAAAQGVYFSDDGGVTWQSTTIMSSSGGGTIAGVSDVFAVGGKVYAGTHDGLYVSTDGGATYVKRTLTSDSYPTYQWVYKVRVQGRMVYVATSDGLLVSADKGYTFVPRTTADGLGGNNVVGLYVNGSIIYAATSGGLSISTDGGQTFINKTTANGLASNVVNAVAVSGSNVYAGTDAGLSISTDAGANFTNTRTTVNGMLVNAVSDIYRNAAGALYLATGNGVSISSDGGVTFTARNPASWATGGGTSINSVYEKSGKIYAGGYPSFYQSTDNGVTWSQEGLPSSFVSSVSVANNGTLYFHVSNSSGYSAIAISTDRGKTFAIRNIAKIQGGSGSAYVNGVYVDGNTLYVAAAGILVSGDGGNTFTVRTKTSNGLSEYSVAKTYALGTTVYAVGPSGFLDKSTNGGGNFTYQAISGLNTGAMAVSGANVYLAGSGLDVSNNGCASFVRRTTANGLPSNTVTDVAINSLGQVYVISLNYGLAVSTNSGQTFATVGTAPVSAYNVSACGGPLYVGTYSSGLYISQDSAATFVLRNSATNGLVNDYVTDACYVP